MTLEALSRLLAIPAVMVMTLPVLAQDKSGPNLGAPAEGASPGGVSTMGLAQDLYVMGVAQSDTVTVLSAAKLAASVDVRTVEPAALDPAKIAFAEGEDNSRRKGTPVAAPAAPAPMLNDGTPRAAARARFLNATSDEESSADAPVTADAMFAQARELAADDETLQGVIDGAMAEAARGRFSVVVSWLSRLPAGSTDVWEVPFYGNASAEIAVMGDGDANIHVVITDENGNVLCNDISWSESLYCDFTPARDGYFYVTVDNVSKADNSYSLMTN